MLLLVPERTIDFGLRRAAQDVEAGWVARLHHSRATFAPPLPTHHYPALPTVTQEQLLVV